MTYCKLVPVEPTPEMDDLVKRLRIKAGMIELGELIAWGSDSALMREAADALERLAAPDMQGEPAGFVNPEFVRRLGVTFEAIVLSSEAGRDRTMPLYTAPQPTEQQPAPDVAGLVEALSRCRHQASYSIGEIEALEIQLGRVRDIANEALAAHRKGAEL